MVVIDLAKRTAALALAVLLVAGQPATAQDSDGLTPLTLDAIFADRDFAGQGSAPVQWIEGTGYYTTVDASPTVENGQDIVRHDPATGDTSVLVTAAQLTPDGRAPLHIDDYHWSADGRYLLVQTNAQTFRRYKPLGDFWVLDLASGDLRQIAPDRPASALMYAKFSPDSTRVAYWFANNIYVEDLATGSTTQLTHDGSDLIVNGTGDWVNEEEFGLRDGFSWSPDSRSIAYWQFDTEGVGTFYMMDNLDGPYSQPVPLQYPKAGTTNSAVRVGVVPAVGGDTVWVQLEGDPRNTYVPEMDWADNSDELIIQYMNRLQNRDEVMLVDVATGQPRTLFTETDEAWVDVNEQLTWFDNGAHFTWLSERDGWRRLYRIDRETGEAEAITPAGEDVIELVSIDTGGGWAYYLASPDDNAGRYLYRSPLSGDASAERLTPAGPSAVHAYNMSADARWAIHTWSRINEPPTRTLVSLPDHADRQVIIDNARARANLAATPQGDIEFFTVDIGDGVALDAWMMFPPDFDPEQSYPLLMYVYGEPASQTVINNWRSNGDTYMWHLLMTQQGYIVASVDNHGTPAPRGRDWRKAIYGQIGVLSSADQAAGLRAMLADRPYLDADRVGIWGWSGGGSMTLNMMFRHPELYHAGIAIAHVADQRLYDTIYQERYMGTPQVNPEGFEQGSPITHAAGLEGDLLIIHGTGDDNVHYQATEQLVDRLVTLDKDFEMMAYPNRTHGISERTNSRRHLYRTMTNFLLEHLPPNEEEGEE